MILESGGHLVVKIVLLYPLYTTKSPFLRVTTIFENVQTEIDVAIHPRQKYQTATSMMISVMVICGSV